MTTETLPAVVPAEPTTPIKPSEALRLGRLLVPTGAIGSMFECSRGEVVAACALGAMWVGYHGLGPVDLSNPAQDARYVELDAVIGSQRLACPGCHPRPASDGPTWLIFHLNDDHGWDTNAIAEWLEGQGL